MIGGRGSSYIYLVLVAVIGGFLMAGGSRMNDASYLTKYNNPTPTSPAGASVATPTPGAVGLPGGATATPTPTPTP